MEDEYFIDDYDHVTPDIFYTTTCIPGKGCDLNLFESSISTSCDCDDQTNCADSITCRCLQSTNSQSPNYLDKRLVDNKILENDTSLSSCSVIECNTRCRCSKNCSNRLVQFGPNGDLEIMEAGAKGYGVRCKHPLQIGQFVCEYAGEIISEQEAAQRRKSDSSNYIFTLNEFVSDDNVIKTVIDATCIGNIGRYINHSCNPNCIVVPVRVDSLIPKLAIFSKRAISAGEEITYNYCTSASTSHHEASGQKLCLCGHDNCAKFLPATF